MKAWAWMPLVGAVVGGLVGIGFGESGLAIGMLLGAALPTGYLVKVSQDQEAALLEASQVSRRLERITGRAGDLDSLEADLLELRAQVQAQAGLLSQLDLGVVLVDGRRRITAITPRAAALLGVLPTAVLGLPLLAVSGMLPAEGALALADGTERQVELEAADGGQLTVRLIPYGQGAALVLRDVTELYQLKQAGQELVANLSHELRTPLTAIGGYLETALDDSISPEERQRFLEVAMREVGRMGDMVDSMLDLASLEGKRRPPRLAPVDIDQLVQEIAESLAPLFASRQITLICRAESGQTLASDPSFLQEILLNCLDNAQKYTAPGGTVTLGARAADQEVVVTVEDTGRGIAAEDLPHIFDRFYRVDRARSRASGGTGLGLAIAHHLAEAVGAHLEAKSVSGVGTTLSLHLPQAAAESLESPAGHGP